MDMVSANICCSGQFYMDKNNNGLHNSLTQHGGPVHVIYQRTLGKTVPTEVGCWGGFHHRPASSPNHSLEICVSKISYSLWAFQAETLHVCPLGTHTKLRPGILTLNVISSIVDFREIISESPRNVSETTPWFSDIISS